MQTFLVYLFCISPLILAFRGFEQKENRKIESEKERNNALLERKRFSGTVFT